MSNKNLVKAIVNNNMNKDAANALEVFMNAHDTIVNADVARINAISTWEISHDYRNCIAAARRKDAKTADVHAADVLKTARAVIVEGEREKMQEKTAGARADMKTVMVVFFSRGGKNDKSIRAQAFCNFYKKYTEYALELSENTNTPAGRAAISALNNVWTKCFGFTLSGKLGNSVSKKVLNAIGVKLANARDNRCGADGIAVFKETEVKKLLVYIVAALSLDGTLDNVIVK